MTTMVTDQTRSAVWRLLFDLERNFRYYTVKADQLQRQSNWLRFGLLVGALSEGLLVYPLLQISWGWILILCIGILLGILAVSDALFGQSRDSTILKFTALVCDNLKTEAERLWRDLESGRINTEEAEIRYNSIIRQWEKATDKVLLATDNRLNEKCQKDAQQIMNNRRELESQYAM